MYILQAGRSAMEGFMYRLPTFAEMTTFYGPYLGLVLFLVIMMIAFQFIWYRTTLSAKNGEIERLIHKETMVMEQLMKVFEMIKDHIKK